MWEKSKKWEIGFILSHGLLVDLFPEVPFILEKYLGYARSS